MIRIEHVGRNYGSIHAVQDVSLGIKHGEIVGLLGHNGAGKTTLMKMLTGYIEPTAGSLSVGGHDLVEERKAAQRLIGYLPEHAPLYHDMLVQDYLLMMAELRGVPSSNRAAACLRAAKDTGLEERLLQPIGTLSKGFRQRVGLAQAIVHRPKLLVLDEPTNGLDPVQIQSIRDLIRTLGRDTTIILSTHILQEVEAVCDRVLILIGGRLVADDSLEGMLAGTTVELRLQHTPDDLMEALEQLDCVERVTTTGERNDAVTATITPAKPGELGPALVELAHERGWRVDHISPTRKTLEMVFRQLQADHVAAGAQA